VTNFLFWNFRPRLGVKHPESILARTALSLGIDLVILVECIISPDVILAELNQEAPSFYSRQTPNRRFRIFARFPGEFLELLVDTQRMCVWRLRLPAQKEILIAIVHFPDRRNHPPSDQLSLSYELAAILRHAEDLAGHSRTILVGDFNMNPFDHGMVDINGFGAMMTKELARKHSLGVEESRGRFYNPMWSRLGDLSAGPPGTFYHPRNDNSNIYWHMLDQILIRPDLIRALREDSIQVLTNVLSGDGEIDLIQEKRKPWRLAVSDHLPILFQMNLSEDLPDG
jgi:hypothetical protein